MPTYILKLNDEKFDKVYYMEWSTVVDAPITNGLSIEEFKEFYKEEYGTKGMDKLQSRLERVEKYGVSGHPPFNIIDELLDGNRAGNNETELDLEGILEKYCRNKSE